MFDIININFICVDYKYFYDKIYKNIEIFIKNEYDTIIFASNYNIRSKLSLTLNLKNIYIDVNDINKESLETTNFSVGLPKNMYFVYTYYNSEPSKSLIFFNNYNYFPFVFMGLPNLKDPLEIKIVCEYNSLLENLLTMSDDEKNSLLEMLGIDIDTLSENTQTQNIFLFNNYEGNYNYLSNTLVFRGWIYKIIISSGSITDDDSSSVYELFQIKNSISLDIGTNIYFYNQSNTFSYILYLNNYNYVDYKSYPENYESIILLIEYYIRDEYTSSASTNNYSTIYSCILEINLQTFNSAQLADGYTIEYYNSMFFKNYVNPSYGVKSISMFCYDYEKYFTNTIVPPEFYNIDSWYYDLYDKIILTDANLEIPSIIDLTLSQWFINFDHVKLIDLINPYSENNYFNKLTQSKKINLDTIVNYLSKFKLVKYNVYKLNNTVNHYQRVHDTDIILRTMKKNKFVDNTNLLNYNYVYDDKYAYVGKKNNAEEWIDFNNNIMNSIKCKVIFEYGFGMSYSICAKLYLNNYNIRVYNKKYEFENCDDKKKLITMLLFLASVPWGIKIIFYNTLNSQPSVNSKFNQYLVPNPFYLFNQLNLLKNHKQFDTFIEAKPNITNSYDNQYLKFNININTNYYLLFLYTNKNELEEYDELVFNYSQYIFKIFKIKSEQTNPNGNVQENKDLFYIGFQNLTELNIFINYVQYGIFNVKPNNLTNYFNFAQGIFFCNYYNINNYWVLDTLPPPAIPYNDPIYGYKNKIYFSINDLKSNQIFLYGNLTINKI